MARHQEEGLDAWVSSDLRSKPFRYGHLTSTVEKGQVYPREEWRKREEEKRALVDSKTRVERPKFAIQKVSSCDRAVRGNERMRAEYQHDGEYRVQKAPFLVLYRRVGSDGDGSRHSQDSQIVVLNFERLNALTRV